MNLDGSLLLPRYQVYWLLVASVHVNGNAIVDRLAEMAVCPRFKPRLFLKMANKTSQKHHQRRIVEHQRG